MIDGQKWLDPTAKVLYPLFASIGEGMTLSPGHERLHAQCNILAWPVLIFLLGSYGCSDTLIDVLGKQMKKFLRRLEVCARVHRLRDH